jgi:serine/threonine-protein kinase
MSELPQQQVPHRPFLAGQGQGPPDAGLADLLDQLRRPGLLEPGQAEQFLREFAPAGLTAHEVGRELLKRGVLTPFQVNHLLGGKGQDLLVGPYALLSRRGAGGMGQVFKARHGKLGRVVAVKLIHPRCLGNEAAVQRFLREMRLVSRLDHPPIVHALDAGQEADGRLYLVMEHVEGTDLARLVKEKGPLSPRLACDVVRQAALALEHAHEHARAWCCGPSRALPAPRASPSMRPARGCCAATRRARSACWMRRRAR